jgi:uncharacterized membrane protein
MRYTEIDIIKGVAVIFMIIFHGFYFPNQYGFKEIKYDTDTLKVIAKIAQIIFIISVGINLHLSKRSSLNNKETNEEYIQKSFKRIIKITILAIFMSIFTKFIFGEKYVKFGILHFIAISSLLLFNFTDNKIIIQVLLVGCFFFYYLSLQNPNFFDAIPSKLSFILGFNKNYQSMDHFPLLPWIILILIGILLGNILSDYKIKSIVNEIDKKPILRNLELLGNKSLEIYAIHWVVLYIFFSIIYSNFIRKKIL